jgi:hypothetical protein
MGSLATAAPIQVGGLEFSPAGAEVNGRSIGNMAAEWWRFNFETPASVNPNAGAPFVPGPLTSEGTSFLYGAPRGTEEATLFSIIREGQVALLPVIPWANLRTDPDETAADLLGQLDPLVAGSRNMVVTVNGVDFETETGLSLYDDFREMYPASAADETFGVTFPPSDAVIPGLENFVTDLIVADGHWLLITDLPLGEHTVVVEGTDASGESFVVTQQIRVVSEPAALALLAAGLAVIAPFARRRKRREPEEGGFGQRP